MSPHQSLDILMDVWSRQEFGYDTWSISYYTGFQENIQIKCISDS